MAIPFKSPIPKHTYNSIKERSAITRHFTKRNVPKSANSRLLLASWNIANLDVQGRTPNAHKLIAHIMKRFDLIAVQEVNDEFRSFAKIVKIMGSGFDFVMTDTAGNNERLAYVFRKNKVTPTSLFGELALRPREYPKRTVKVKWTDANGVDKVDKFSNHKFVPFDRNPFIGSFKSGKMEFVLLEADRLHNKNRRFKSWKRQNLRSDGFCAW